MKKNILQLSIVFVAILMLSTMSMARGKISYHSKWWNPLSGLWSAIYQLQDNLSKMNKEVDDKLAALSQSGGTTPTSSSIIDPGAGPIVCPGCTFPKDDLAEEIKERLRGGFLAYAKFAGTDLSDVDFSNADLRGAKLADCDLYEANFSGANLSPVTLVIGGTPWEYKTDFSHANLERAILTGAVGLDQVIWSSTVCPDGSNSDDNDGDNKTCSEQNFEF